MSIRNFVNLHSLYPARNNMNFDFQFACPCCCNSGSFYKKV